MICYGMPTLIELQTVEQHCALCSQLGLQFVELNTNFPGQQLHLLDADELKALLNFNAVRHDALTIEIENNGGLVYTGAKVTVTASSSTGTAVLEYEIVILGDLSGDGYVDAFDSAKIMEYYFGATLTDIQKIAADVSRDDSIDSFDAAKIMNKYFDNYESSLGA